MPLKLTALASHTNNGEGQREPNSRGRRTHIRIARTTSASMSPHSIRSSPTSRARAEEWSATTPRQRAELLERIVADTLAVAEEWNAAACAGEGIRHVGTRRRARSSSAASARSCTWPSCFASVDARHRAPRSTDVSRAGACTSRASASPCSVVPSSIYGPDALRRRITAEVWMEPGVTEADVQATQALVLRVAARVTSACRWSWAPATSASLGPRDVLTKTVRRGQGRGLEGQPGQRLPRAVLVARPRVT